MQGDEEDGGAFVGPSIGPAMPPGFGSGGQDEDPGFVIGPEAGPSLPPGFGGGAQAGSGPEEQPAKRAKAVLSFEEDEEDAA